MGRRNKGKRGPDAMKENSNTLQTTSSVSDSNVVSVGSDSNAVQVRKVVDTEINTHLATISDLREKVAMLQKRRSELENGILGVLDNSLSTKDQWKVIKKLKNEENKMIFSFIDNVRQESKLAHKDLKEGKKSMELLQKQMAERHSKEEGALSCSICLSLYCNPFVVECGHVFCYFCLIRWVKKQDWNGNCAACRTKLVKVPTPALFVEQAIDLCLQYSNEQKQTEYAERLEMEKSAFATISNPWKEWYAPSANLIEDLADNVDRCGQCGWELEDQVCGNCNAYYPDYRTRGEELITSDDAGVDIRFSDNESHSNDEEGAGESGSDVEGFIVDDNHVDYHSGTDNLSDHFDDDSQGSSGQRNGNKRQRVIVTSDEEEEF